MTAKSGVKVKHVFRFAIALGAIPLRAWVMSFMWRWFVTPIGVQALGIAQAFGVSLLIHLLTDRGEPPPEEKRSTTVQVAIYVAYPILVLGMGAVAHLFVTP